MKKLMILSLMAIGFVSCSKDDVQPNENNSDFKIEIVLNGAIDDYVENLAINITNEKDVAVNLLGHEWKEGQRTQTSPNSVTYFATGSPTNKFITTSEKVNSLFLIQTMLPIKPNPQKLTSEVTLYQNGKVKSKKTQIFKGQLNEQLYIE